MITTCQLIHLSHGGTNQTIPRFIQLAELTNLCHTHICIGEDVR